MFIPGETVIHEFVIPFTSTDIDKVVITYKQDNRIVIMKELTSGFEPIEPENENEESTKTKITVDLSQAESLLFENSKDVKIQLNVISSTGRSTSSEFKSSTGEQHYRQVITDA